MLNYLVDLDWSALTSGRSAEFQRLRVNLETNEALAADLGRQLKRLVEMAKTVGDVHELAHEIMDIKARRPGAQDEASLVRHQILAKRDFRAEDAAELIRTLAADQKGPESRRKLRQAIGRQVEAIDLFRRLPKRLLQACEGQAAKPSAKLEELKVARCIRIAFRNGAERWVIDRGEGDGFGVRFEGAVLPPQGHLEMVEDEFGGKRLRDNGSNEKLAPVKFNRWKAARKRSVRERVEAGRANGPDEESP